MAKCNMDCFNCKYDDCINDYVPKDYSARRAAYYQEHKKELSEKSHNRYMERKAAGLCVECGKKKAVENRTRCLECLLKNRRAANEKNRRKGLQPRAHFDGVDWCRLCGKAKPVEGRTLCSKCLEACQKRALHASTFIDRESLRRRHERAVR